MTRLLSDFMFKHHFPPLPYTLGRKLILLPIIPDGRQGFNLRLSYGMRPSWPKMGPNHCTFQSTHPVRDATTLDWEEIDPRDVSIHAPRTGCDVFMHPTKHAAKIVSIHAPRTGCDAGCQPSPWRKRSCFNPRTPYGMRRSGPCAVRRRRRFQSTHPVRDATLASARRRSS